MNSFSAIILGYAFKHIYLYYELGHFRAMFIKQIFKNDPTFRGVVSITFVFKHMS